MLLLIPIFVCGALGAAIGYFFRYQLQLRRVATLASAVVIFLVFEITTGALSSKYSLRENLVSQLDALPPFLFLYLLPAAFGSFSVARRFRTWSE